MTDIVDKATRSRMMSGIKGKDTKPEILVRKGIFAKGFRYRIHDKKLPGKPDLVLKKYKAVIFVNGCFWHGHGCDLFKWPKSNEAFWKTKITNNIINDKENQKVLIENDWRIMVIWECALRGKEKFDFVYLIDIISSWLLSGDNSFLEISGGCFFNHEFK